MKLFSPDNKFMRAMSRLGDLLLLNLVFLLCCVPLVTIGAARTALYTVSFRLIRDRESRPLAAFFRAFKQNFRSGTLLWLLLALAAGAAVLDLWLATAYMQGFWLMKLPFFLLLLLAAFTGAYAFPLLSQFENSVKQTLKNALFLSLGCLPRTLPVTALNLLPFALLFYDLYLFLNAGFLWAFLYFAAAAYLNAKLLEPVFAGYREEEREDAP